MVNYFIHVSFTKPAADTFERLTEELRKFQVGSGIQSEDGRGYALPTGSYVYHGKEAVNEVRDGIFRIASAIQPDGVAVLVSEVATASWTGLEELPVLPDDAAQ
ncbi:MAG: hypothetical protein K2P77_09845 [Burkholderiaceae bacterium]|nr:hypothetical protein [Burkholderiaceae bacterium]